MSYFTEISYKNDKTTDAYGRARVSNLVATLESTFEYDLRPLRYVTSTSGAGTVTKASGISRANLTLGTASGDLALLQSKKYIRYQPGKSQLIYMSSLLGAAKVNVQSEIGYYDNNNGVFFRQANGPRVVVRSNTSGSPVDTEILQANWNVDKMDGTGPSGITINFANSQMYVIDLDWPDGRVRFGFYVAGAIYYCHQFFAGNTLIVPFMNTGSLPVRARITNTGTAASGTFMTLVSANISSEGGFDTPPGLPFSASNGITTINVTTRRPILSIQVGATFAGLVNRGQLVIDLLTALSGGGTNLIEVVLNGTLTGASFTAVDATNSSTLKDVSATAISGGTVIAQGYVSGNTDTSRGVRDFSAFGSLDILGNSFDGTTGDILSLVGTAVTGTNVSAGIFLWHEIR